MEDKQIYEHVQQCISKLGEDFIKNKDNCWSEADLHFRLYFLLNNFVVNNKMPFWENWCIMPEGCKSAASDTNENNDKTKVDLFVYDPDNPDGEPKVAIEIKFGGCRTMKEISKSMKDKKYMHSLLKINLPPIISADKNKINSAFYDFLKLLGYNSSIKKIYLYFGYGDSNDLNDVVKVHGALLEFVKLLHTDIDCILVHTASSKTLFNDDIVR